MRLGMAMLLLAGCGLDGEEFHRRFFTCDPGAADPGCGTDRSGRPMICYPGQPLGGQGFCVESCDRGAATPDGGPTVCVAAGAPDGGAVSGARLRACNPRAEDPGCGASALSCLRTDLVEDKGVCLATSTCTTNRDCRDPVRSTCSSEVVGKVVSSALGRTDHGYCLQTDCKKNQAACSPGEVCLLKVVPESTGAPDMCVPSCDANLNCPPNSGCFAAFYGPLAPPICVPGLPGFRCSARADCLTGDCLDVGAGLKVCTVRCTNDDDCAKYDSQQGTFLCNDRKLCVAPETLAMSLFCIKETDCPAGQACLSDGGGGLCLTRCRAGQGCPSIAGIPAACTPLGADTSVCFPATLGAPCARTEDCVRGLQCRDTGAAMGPPKACTILCRTDEDCAQNRFAKEGTCSPQGICLAKAMMMTRGGP